MGFVLRECHWFRSGGWLVHCDPEEIIELVGFNLVVDVCRGLITIKSSITDPVFCLGCSTTEKQSVVTVLSYKVRARSLIEFSIHLNKFLMKKSIKSLNLREVTSGFRKYLSGKLVETRRVF